MQIATWNVNSLKVRLPQVLEWLATTNCDVLALQELKIDNANFPESVFTDLGYYCAFNGQKTYNGVAIISKLPLCDIVYDIPDYQDHQKRVITATIGGKKDSEDGKNDSKDGIKVICAYIVNGESVGSDKFAYKMGWLQALHKYIASVMQNHDKVMLLGDFNIAPHDIDVYDPIAWQGSVLCSDDEREKWHQFLELGLHDSFRLFNQESKQYTWWDYRGFAFRRKLGLRIDHILISDGLKNSAIDCVIDVNPRRNERPSDHTPVVLSLRV
jgi:exodeoxyribonuclease-3